MQSRVIAAVVVSGVVGLVWLAGWASAEAVNKTPAQLKASADHVVVGTVQQVYTRTAVVGKYKRTYHVAELRVAQQEKGDGLDGLVYVRYWTQRFNGWGTPPPGTNGHRGLPQAGDAARAYLKDGKDGGLDVLFPNGFETGVKLPAKDAVKEGGGGE